MIQSVSDKKCEKSHLTTLYELRVIDCLSRPLPGNYLGQQIAEGAHFKLEKVTDIIDQLPRLGILVKRKQWTPAVIDAHQYSKRFKWGTSDTARTVRVCQSFSVRADSMSSPPGHTLAVRVTTFFLRCSGIWPGDQPSQQRILDIIATYSVLALILALAITTADLYHSFEDVNKMTYAAMYALIVGMGLWKSIIFTSQRKIYHYVIIHAKDNFWFSQYDDYGTDVMKQCTTRSGPIIILIATMCHLTSVMYCLSPWLAHPGEKSVDRILPSKIWFDLPLTASPWYELIYALEIILANQCCVCYFCFDNFLCLINITLAGQFIILQQELRNLCGQPDDSSATNENLIYTRFSECVIKHQNLMKFIDVVKELHRHTILGMVIVLSLLISVCLYQIVPITENFLYKMNYVPHMGIATIQLYFFMLTCNELTDASMDLAHAAYDVKWFLLRSKILKKKLGNDLMIVIRRSQKPCNLTVGGFSAVTLQTFTSICKTAFSFLTVMRQTAQRD